MLLYQTKTSQERYLSLNHTPIGLKQIIMRHLLHWLKPTDNSTAGHDEENTETDDKKLEIFKALNQQKLIGWNHFIRGRICIEWGKISYNHFENGKITNISAEKWGLDLLAINCDMIRKVTIIIN
jgi:hypothetical protein